MKPDNWNRFAAGLLAFEPAIEKIHDIECKKQHEHLPVCAEHAAQNSNDCCAEQVCFIRKNGKIMFHIIILSAGGHKNAPVCRS